MIRQTVAVALGLLSLGAADAARGDVEGIPRHFGAWQFQWDNDSFTPSDPTDRDYTNGLRLGLTRIPSERSTPAWSERLVEKWCRLGRLCGAGDRVVDVGYAFGHSIYTPYRYDTTRPQIYDRPYVGHLFGSWLIQATTQDDDEMERLQTTFEFQLGWVGPHAYGEDVQNGWHRLLNENQARGWENQLRDEPTLNAHLLWRLKLGGRHLDVVPHAGIALGTVTTHANLGGTLRFGTDLSRLPAFGLPQIRRLENHAYKVDAAVFAGVDGRYVIRNLFVEGGFFKEREGARIDAERLVYDLKAGFSARWKSWTVHYTWTHRSREFESRTLPDGGDQIFRSYAVTHHLTLP